jgi:hypothetical protein
LHRVFGQVLEITLFPLGKRLTVGEEKLQIARMRRNDMRKCIPLMMPMLSANERQEPA